MERRKIEKNRQGCLTKDEKRRRGTEESDAVSKKGQ